MLKRYLTIIVIFTALVFSQNADSLIDEAIRLHNTRHIDPANLDRSLEILRALVAEDSTNTRALSELAHVHFIMGDILTGKKEKIEFYKQGVTLALRATAIDDRCVEGHFWQMALTGRIGQTKGVLNSLGLVPEIKKGINRVLELDPRHTGALDARAMLYYELPKMFGGNLDISREALDQAIAIDSNYTILYIDMARVLIKKKEYERARWYLNRALAVTDPKYAADFILDDQPTAQRLLQEIQGK